MAEINDLNITDASNTARFPENQAPSTVNNGARALEGILARGFKDSVEPTINSTGSANAYAVAANRTIGAYYDGMKISFHASFANTGAATLDVDGVGAKTIKKHHDQDLASGDIETNQVVEVVYSATDDTFQMISMIANASTGGLSNVVEDTTPELGGDLIPGSNFVGRTKGGDIASASTLVVDTDGDFFDVTGTTNFAGMTVAANRHFFLQFDGVLTMTHGASLTLPGAANITTAAGDVGEFFSTATDTVLCVNYSKANGQAISSVGSDMAIKNIQSLTGSSNYTLTAGTTDIIAILIGPGGTGGTSGSHGCGATSGGGGGGGGGGVVMSAFTIVGSPSSTAYVVTAGSNNTFNYNGTTITATAGSTGGTGANWSCGFEKVQGAGGAGGTGSGGDVNGAGGDNGHGYGFSAAGAAGGGGFLGFGKGGTGGSGDSVAGAAGNAGRLIIIEYGT
jgi:hypothetical protein